MIVDAREKPTSWRTAIAPLLALAVHLVAAWLLWRVPPRSSKAAPALDRTDESVVELADFETPPAREPTATPAPAAHRPIVPDPFGGVARASRIAPAGEAKDPIRASAPGEAADPSAGVGGEGFSFSPGPVAPDIGLGGTNRFLPKSEGEVEAAAAARAASEMMKHTGWDRDRGLGLGPEGPVLTALAEGTSQSLAPVRGRATFIAKANAEGEVTSLELEEAEGGRPGWADARLLALAGLRGKKLRIPAGAKGAYMKIEVTSAWKLPSGQDPGTNVSVFHVPVSKGEGKDSASMAILDPIPKIEMAYLELGPGVTIPVPTVRIRLFETNMDPTNIGAKARRVIHTHLVDSSPM